MAISSQGCASKRVAWRNLKVNATRKLDTDSHGTETEKSYYRLSLKVGGLTSRESPVEDGHLTWINGLVVNIENEVKVRIGDGVNADKQCGQNNFPIWC